MLLTPFSHFPYIYIYIYYILAFFHTFSLLTQLVLSCYIRFLFFIQQAEQKSINITLRAVTKTKKVDCVYHIEWNVHTKSIKIMIKRIVEWYIVTIDFLTFFFLCCTLYIKYNTPQCRCFNLFLLFIVILLLLNISAYIRS